MFIDLSTLIHLKLALYRETAEHLLWSCKKVIEFRNTINSNLSNYFNFLKHVPNTSKCRILCQSQRGSDNFDFLFYTYVNRFIWISKIKKSDPDLLGFKNYLGQCLKIQKSAGVLTCLELLDIDSIWL